ncbi:DUF483 domain-containing protein [Candidatus Woesearchaeota archaeon]|nr:DUF483 domain-containing protein [Candidatus Woesearchaeota archaeon]
MMRALIYKDQELTALFGSRIRALEVLFVLEDIKPVCRFELQPQQLMDVEPFFQSANLTYLASSIQPLMTPEQDTPDAQQQSQLSELTLVYISKNRSLAQEARIAETRFDHRRFGTLLGYPQCCIQFFCEHLTEAEELHHDHTLITARQSTTFNPLLNISLQFFDWRIISHYPCHFNCPASIDQAQRMLKAIAKYNKDLVTEIEQHMRSLVLYTNETGVHVFEGAKKKGNNFYYKSVLLTSTNPVHDLLMKGDTIKKISINHV